MKQKHVKMYEEFKPYIDDEYSDESLETFEYFVRTYENGNFSQLRKMLQQIRSYNQIEDLISFLENDIDSPEIISWIARN